MSTLRQKKIERRRMKKLKRRKAYERLRNYNAYHEISIGKTVVSHSSRTVPTVPRPNVFIRAAKKLFRRKVI